MPSICMAGTAAAAMLQNRPIEGRVHSVFRKVLNVEMPALEGAVDNLYSLGRQDVPVSPAMLVTDLRRAFFGVSPGDVMRIHDDLIEVGEYRIDIPVSLPLWQQEERTCSGITDAETLEGYFSNIAAVLLQRVPWPQPSSLLLLAGQQPRRDDPYGRAFQKGIDGLEAWGRRSLSERKLTPPIQETAGLLGLGAGLTPSGDDYISGVLTGLRQIPAGAGLLDSLGKAVQANLARTNRLSQHFLAYAIAGHWGRLEDQMVAALCAGERSSYLAAAEALSAYGSSSGLDEMLGLRTGLRLGVLAAGMDQIAQDISTDYGYIENHSRTC